MLKAESQSCIGIFRPYIKRDVNTPAGTDKARRDPKGGRVTAFANGHRDSHVAHCRSDRRSPMRTTEFGLSHRLARPFFTRTHDGLGRRLCTRAGRPPVAPTGGHTAPTRMLSVLFYRNWHGGGDPGGWSAPRQPCDLVRHKAWAGCFGPHCLSAASLRPGRRMPYCRT